MPENPAPQIPAGVFFANTNDEFVEIPRHLPPVRKARKELKPGQIDLEKTTVQELFDVHPPSKLSNEFANKFLTQHTELIPPYPYKFKDSQSLVGIEVEVENVLRIDPNITLGFWSIHEDGSLRNNGREFKTSAMPLRYTQPALTQLFNGLNDSVDFSSRTSIHVHLDVRQLTLSQLYGMSFTYGAVENLLFKFASQERRKNIFCVPISESLGLAGVNKAKNMVSFLSSIEDYWSKYSAYNLLPIANFGTVEFRQMCGTNNVTKLLIWMDMLSRLKIYAYKFHRTEIVKQISGLNTNSQYRGFVDGVFGDLAAYLDTSNLLKDMENTTYVIKNCALNNVFHSRVLSTMDLESNFNDLFKTEVSNISKLSKTQKECLSFLKKDIAPSMTLEKFYLLLKHDPIVYDLIVSKGFQQHYYHLLQPIAYAAPKFKDE